MRLTLAAALAATCLAVPALAQTAATCPIQTGDCSFSAPAGVATQVTFGAARGGGRYQRICSASLSVNLWATSIPGVVPGPGVPGSYLIAGPSAGQACEEYPIAGSGYIPSNSTYVAPETGTAAGAVRVN